MYLHEPSFSGFATYTCDAAFGAFGFEHDAASRMNRVLYPNGVDLDLERDGRGRITEIAFTRSGVYLDGEMRRLDAVGNTTTRERSGEDELRFGYDVTTLIDIVLLPGMGVTTLIDIVLLPGMGS